MSTVTRTTKTCPNCGCAMRYVPLLGRLKCDYCDGETNVGKHLETLAEMTHFIVPHRMESAHAIHALAVKFATDDSYPDDALSKVQVLHTEIVLLPCYRYKYWSVTSRRTIIKTNYAGRIDGLDYPSAQFFVEKSIPYIQEFSGDFITDEVVPFDSPYEPERYFFAPMLGHRRQHHTVQKIDYVHVAVARVIYSYEGEEHVFWSTCYRADCLYSPLDPGQRSAFFKPWRGVLVPLLILVMQVLGGLLFFRHSLPPWMVLSVGAMALGGLGIPARKWLYRLISQKRRHQFLEAFVTGGDMGGIKRFKYGLCDLFVMPGTSIVIFGLTCLIQKFLIL